MFNLELLVDLHLPPSPDNQFGMRFIQAQHVQDIAEWVYLRPCRSWQVEVPIEHLLPLGVVWGQAQVLDAGAYRVFIVIGGFMTNGQSHTTSR